MLRPLLAFLTLCLAAFLLAPTVASVHQKVEDLSVDRELPWQLFKWIDDPTPPPLGRPDCDHKDYRLFSEITHWPERMRKNESITLVGHVGIEELFNRGVHDVEVDLFVNQTKEEPGIHLGTVKSEQDGTFRWSGLLPIDLQANHYHIVAHAKAARINCWNLHEHWSDPEMDVVSNAEIVFDEVLHPVVGRPLQIPLRVRDVAGGPVQNATVEVTLGGKTQKLVTDDGGRIVVPYTAQTPGNLTINAAYRGNDYYDPTSNKTSLRIAEEDLVLDQAETGLVLLRSSASPISGHVYVAPKVRTDTVTLTFTGIRVVACEGCAPAPNVTVPLAEDGSFEALVIADKDQTPGNFTYAVSGGGLKKSYKQNGSLQMQPVVRVEAEGTSLFGKSWSVDVTMTDEAGRPYDAELAILTPAGWSQNATGASGQLAFSSTAEACGRTSAHAIYNGTGHVRAAQATDEMVICGYLALIPPWLGLVPWWAWLLAPLVLYGAWILARSLRERYSPTILSGPALTLSFTEPRDEAAGYAAVGETVLATAFLEEPLPDGHVLRMGTWRNMEERPLDEKLRASIPWTPTTLGDVPIRAEILDPKGRVVTRRTATLRVVRYAQEIEARYLALRRERGAGEHVTPREFEAWLRERAPGLDGAIARRLVHVFEEADYSPRDAGREEFAAYLAAERGVQEVSPDAVA